MNFWNYKKLALRLKDNKVSWFEQFFYLALQTPLQLINLLTLALITIYYTAPQLLYILIPLSITSNSFIREYLSNLNLVQLCIYTFLWFFLNIFILVQSYRINAMGDNKRFLTRFISLSFPLNIRILVIYSAMCGIFLLLFYTFLILDHHYLGLNIWKNLFDTKGVLKENIIHKIITIILTLYFYMYFFKRMSSSLKIASSQTAKS